LACNRCGGVRPFISSDKIRVNANGKRLDAWLVYNCAHCDNSWNRPLVTRRNIREIDPLSLHAMQANDADLARRLAFDVDDLRRSTERVDEFAAVEVQKQVLSQAVGPFATVDIIMAVPTPTCLRADRLLATELGLSRARIDALQEAGRLLIVPQGARALRRPVRDQTRVTIALCPADEFDVGRAAAGFDAGSAP
jgi:hypothetical protein